MLGYLISSSHAWLFDSTSVFSLFTVSLRVYGHLIYLILILAAEGHSIYVRNLPLNVTIAQLEVEFKRFGPIKQGVVQVRSNRVGSESILYTSPSSLFT